jgi:aspartyl-tRNA(Asn)/glutamyl-tRNA(Gln) amidotransferase subunit A
MARTVEDCAILLQAIAGHDPRDPASARAVIPDLRAALGGTLDGLRIGAPIAFLESISEMSSDTLAAYEAALRLLEGLGAAVEPVDVAWFQHCEIVGRVVLVSEAFSYHEANYQHQSQLHGLPHTSATRVAALLSASDYVTVQRGRAAIRAEIARLMEDIDLIALPTAPQPSRTFDQETAARRGARISLTRPFNLTGQPAISIPCGFSPEGLPIGLQLAGRPFEDATALRAAHAYEQATDCHKQRPPFGT